jgi:hypothetical protein
MQSSFVLLFFVFFFIHMLWRANSDFAVLDPIDWPRIFWALGILAHLLSNFVHTINGICLLAALIWGFLNMPWYVVPCAYIAAGFIFILLHRFLNRHSFEYRAMFVAGGIIIGLPVVLLSQAGMWYYYVSH